MTSTPEPLPSLPPSPVEEQAPRRARRSEDVARAWHDDEPDAHARTNAARKGKGKGKGRARWNGKRRAAGSGEDDDDDDDDEDEEEEGEEENNADGRALEGYPPTKEEEAESRRVQEVRHLRLFLARYCIPSAKLEAAGGTPPLVLQSCISLCTPLMCLRATDDDLDRTSVGGKLLNVNGGRRRASPRCILRLRVGTRQSTTPRLSLPTSSGATPGRCLSGVLVHTTRCLRLTVTATSSHSRTSTRRP